MSPPPMMDFPAFSAGQRHYSATDVIDAAWFRGEVQSRWETSMLGAARKQRGDEEGLEQTLQQYRRCDDLDRFVCLSAC